MSVHAWGAGWQARKRVDLANLKAGLALFEDELVGLFGRIVGVRHAGNCLNGNADAGDARVHKAEGAWALDGDDRGQDRALVGKAV